MNIAIVHEEDFTREQVDSLIKDQRPDCQIEVFASGEELLAAGHGFDLIFLDIRMALKSIGEQKFAEVFEHAVWEADKHRDQRQEMILIRTKNKGFTISRNSIRYIENRGKKVEIHTADGEEPIEIYATMEELTRKLGESFYRCHRGYLVNMAYITGYDSDSISLIGGEKVYLSKKKHGRFVKAYTWFLQNGGGCCV